MCSDADTLTTAKYCGNPRIYKAASHVSRSTSRPLAGAPPWAIAVRITFNRTSALIMLSCNRLFKSLSVLVLPQVRPSDEWGSKEVQLGQKNGKFTVLASSHVKRLVSAPLQHS